MLGVKQGIYQKLKMKILMNGIKKEIKMGREAILKSIKENKPDLIPLPEINEMVFFEEHKFNRNIYK